MSDRLSDEEIADYADAVGMFSNRDIPLMASEIKAWRSIDWDTILTGWHYGVPPGGWTDHQRKADFHYRWDAAVLAVERQVRRSEGRADDE